MIQLERAPFFVISENENYVVIHKPSGFFVHPPEDKNIRVDWDFVILYQLEKQLGIEKLFPLHRLDVGTCGVLVFAKSSLAAKTLNQLFKTSGFKKTYWAVCRGFLKSKKGLIETPLSLDSTGDMAESQTKYEWIESVFIKNPLSEKYPKLYFSLLKAEPLTGRFHQIRRHLNSISHPLIGDSEHGDTRVNRCFKEHFKIQGLCLHAHELSFTDPWNLAPVHFTAPINEKWKQILEIFSASPEKLEEITE